MGTTSQQGVRPADCKHWPRGGGEQRCRAGDILALRQCRARWLPPTKVRVAIGWVQHKYEYAFGYTSN